MKKIIYIAIVLHVVSTLIYCKKTNKSSIIEAPVVPPVTPPDSNLPPPPVATTKKVIILKLDDFGAVNTFNASSTEALDYLILKNKKAAIGVIASRLGADVSFYNKYISAKNTAGQNLFEIWNHGLTHDRGTSDSEFDGTSYAYQKQHFQDADSIVFKRLGVLMHTFGAPFNQNDATTATVIGENENYKVCMYVNPLPSSTFNLNNRVNIEFGTGVVNYNSFVTNYEANKASMKYMVLQGHPYMWNASHVAQFKQVIDYLIADNCEFFLPYEYYLTNGDPKINTYQNCNFTGTTSAIAIGNYTESQLTALGFTSNSLSSLLIPAGLKVILYDNADFTGASKTLTADTNCLPADFDNKTSSMKVSLN